MERFNKAGGFSYNKVRSFDKLNNHSFINMVKYLIDLKDNQVINTPQFIKLLELSCTIYIENKVDQLINNKLSRVTASVFNEKFFHNAVLMWNKGMISSVPKSYN